MNYNICKFNQFGFCKFGESCKKEHENQICSQEGCNRKNCILRHPRPCKYFEANGFCKQGDESAYSHRNTRCKSDIDSTFKEIDKLKKDVEKLKLEIAGMIKKQL